jgi:predicted phage-related endonuclease
MHNRETFLLNRKQGIGGSDVASIMGISQWSSPLEIYNDKTCQELNCSELSDYLKRGIRVEKYILQEYSENTNTEIETNLPPLIDIKYPFMRGNADGHCCRLIKSSIMVNLDSFLMDINLWNYFKSHAHAAKA